MSSHKADYVYLTDVERQRFEELEQICKDGLKSDAADVQKDAVNTFLIQAALLYTDIKKRASLEDMTIEEREFLGQKEFPTSTLVFTCGVITKFLR
jgi:hypothetical protein